MDQVKIGKFIAQCRNEKNITQEELGEKLGVTNKTISRWENGHYLPDIEMMQLLSKEFNISINELISGEKINDSDYKEKAEENLIELQEKKEKARKALNRVELIWTIAALLLAPVHFMINYYYPQNNGTGIGLLILLIGLFLFTGYFLRYYELRLK